MAKQSSFKNMVIVLGVICLVCSALLGVVYVITEEPIAAAEAAKINNAIRAVVPDFDNNPSESPSTVEVSGTQYRYYTATMNGEVVGYAVETSSSKGFGGAVKLMVGFDASGVINSTSVISHSETPGLGAKIDDPEGFRAQFAGFDPSVKRLSVRKDGGDVDAITAATITSRAVCDALSNARAAFDAISDSVIE